MQSVHKQDSSLMRTSPLSYIISNNVLVAGNNTKNQIDLPLGVPYFIKCFMKETNHETQRYMNSYRFSFHDLFVQT